MQSKTIKHGGEKSSSFAGSSVLFNARKKKEMLTRVNKKVSDAACICIVSGTKGKINFGNSFFFQRREEKKGREKRRLYQQWKSELF
jgi:hypothetical protein